MNRYSTFTIMISLKLVYEATFGPSIEVDTFPRIHRYPWFGVLLCSTEQNTNLKYLIVSFKIFANPDFNSSGSPYSRRALRRSIIAAKVSSITP